MRDADSVAVADARLKAAGLDTFVEDDVTCCYARQDKTWVAGPDGHAWEFFYVKEDTGDLRGNATGPIDACCTTD